MTAAPIAVSVEDAAHLLAVSQSTIRTLVADGRLARVPHMGRRIVIAVDELHRFANSSSGVAA